jgi:hypothetical protein
MRDATLRTIIGYAISDPDGRHPCTPEYGVGCLAEARAEADALNDDFAEDLGGGRYGVVTLFADGGATSPH